MKFVLLALAMILLMATVVLADEDTSGWAVCDRHGSDYNHERCIAKVARHKGADAPDVPTTRQEAIQIYEWATAEPKAVSCDTGGGAAGPLLPNRFIEACAELNPTSTPTETLESTATPTVSATPTATPEPDTDVEVLYVRWAVPIYSCVFMELDQDCGQR